MAKITMREAISQALMEEMDRDPAVFIMGEEVGVWGGTYAVTKGFYDKYGPDRVKDTPIAENAILGGAIGAAMVGQRPIAELMTINFAFSAMDYIVNQAAKLRYMFGGQFMLPLVIRAVGGGGRQLGVVAALGPPAVAVLVFEVLLNATSMFNHGNVMLPVDVDRRLRRFVVTPDMHRVHHSIVRQETDSNFGFNVPWWDRLLGTYRAAPAAGQDGMTIGIEQFRDPRELRLGRMLLQPFRDDARPSGRG